MAQDKVAVEALIDVRCQSLGFCRLSQSGKSRKVFCLRIFISICTFNYGKPLEREEREEGGMVWEGIEKSKTSEITDSVALRLIEEKERKGSNR